MRVSLQCNFAVVCAVLCAMGTFSSASADEGALKKALGVAIRDRDVKQVELLLTRAKEESRVSPTSLQRILKDPWIDTREGKIDLVSYSACLKGEGAPEVLVALLEAAHGEGLSIETLGSEVKPSGFKTPLHFAAERGNLEAMRILMGQMDQKSPDQKSICPTSKTHWTPLHSAAQSGSAEAVHLLATSMPQMLQCQNSYGSTPLEVAFAADQPESLLALLEVVPKSVSAEFLYFNDLQGHSSFWRAVLAGKERVALGILKSHSARARWPGDRHERLCHETVLFELVSKLRNPELIEALLLWKLEEDARQALGKVVEIQAIKKSQRATQDLFIALRKALKGLSRYVLEILFNDPKAPSLLPQDTIHSILDRVLAKHAEVKKRLFIEFAYRATYLEAKGEKISGDCKTCFEQNKPLLPFCPAESPACALRYCEDCASDSMDSLLLRKDERPHCQACTKPVRSRVFEHSRCSDQQLEAFKELQVRFAQTEAIADFQFCHTETCPSGGSFPEGEVHHFNCSLCSFQGCLDCGKNHPTEGYDAKGKCCNGDEQAKTERFYRIAEARGRLKAHAAHTPEEIVKLAEAHTPGALCPICHDKVSGEHLVSDHLLDGIYRPCANCGMMTEKIPFFRPGGACNHMTCKTKNSGCGADYSFHRGLSAPLDSVKTNEAMQYEPKQKPWWPGR